MINDIILILLIIIFNIFLLKFSTILSNYFEIYDVPDSTRKLHKAKTPLVGGIIFIINIFLYFIYDLFFIDNNSFFNGYREILAFLLGSTAIYFVGLYDDKFSLKPNTKLVLILIISISLISMSNSFPINYVNFLFYSGSIELKNFGIIFTLFCILVFLNAFNMIDGINGLATSYFIICILYLAILKFNLIFFSFLLIPAFIFLNSNFRNKVFLGDNGSLILGFILSCIFIKYHNQGFIYADQIVLLMILPGIDMIRVAISRLLKKKHAFEADRSHFHHILLKKYNYLKSYIIIISIISFSASISILFNFNYTNIVQIIVIITLYLIFFISKKSN